MSRFGSEIRERTAHTPLWVIVVVGLASIWAWGLPGLHWVFYPFECLVTYLHEASHGLATLLTGGKLLGITVEPNTSGLARRVGGWDLIIGPAGYIGSCLWGGLLLVASRRQGWEKAVLLSLGIFLIGFTVLFGRNPFAWLVGLGWGAFFVWAAQRGPRWALAPFLAFLAVQNSFFALNDLLVLMRLSGGLPATTDAYLMSQRMTYGLVPPIAFAFVISLVAIAIFAGACWVATAPERRALRDKTLGGMLQ